MSPRLSCSGQSFDSAPGKRRPLQASYRHPEWVATAQNRSIETSEQSAATAYPAAQPCMLKPPSATLTCGLTGRVVVGEEQLRDRFGGAVGYQHVLRNQLDGR